MIKDNYRKMKIESELQNLMREGKTREEATSIMFQKYGQDNFNYIIETYLMPFNEISKEIERFDSSNPRLDELLFIKELCNRYNVDRKTIIERIQNVRMINKVKPLETREELQRLKYKREMLQSRRKDINRPLSCSEKKAYFFGLLGTSIASLAIFYPESPLLVALITMAYAAGIPSIKTDLEMKEDKNIINQLVDLDSEIEFFEEKLDRKTLDVKGKDIDSTYEVVLVKKNTKKLN